jgi:hypothetical protein
MPLAERLGRMQPSPVDYNLDLKGLESGHSLKPISVGEPKVWAILLWY